MSKRTSRGTKKTIKKKPERRKGEFPSTEPLVSHTVALTEPEQDEFSANFLRWLLAMTIVTLALVFAPTYFALPWVLAGGIIIQSGLAEFSGKVFSLSANQLYGILLSLLVFFVIGPTLLLLSWRASLQSQSGKVFGLRGILFMLGGIMTFAVALPAIPLSVKQTQVMLSMRAAQNRVEAKDAMIQDLGFISFHAREFKARPFADGGGSGSYFGYNIPPRLSDTDHGGYLTMEVGEDQLVVKGISKQYPASSIIAIIDENGTVKRWTFGGEF
jgi:hypothetical protein